MKSIKQRLIIFTLILIFIPLLISNIANISYISNSYEKELEHNNILTAGLLADQVTAFIEKGYAITEQITLNNDVIGFKPENQKQVILNVIDKHPYFDLLYIQGTDGMQTARTSGENGDRSSRWWFIKAKDEQSSFVSKSYYSVNGNVPVTTIAMPIYDNNETFVGVMGADIKLNMLQEIVEKYSEGSKYSFLVDGEGVIIAHPDKLKVSELYNYKTMKKTVLKTDNQGKIITDENGNQVTEELDIAIPDTLKQITEKALQGESGFVTYKDNDGVDVVSAYQNISLPGMSDQWAVITVENKDDATAFITNTQFFNILIGIFAIIGAFIITSIVSTRITYPIKKSSEYLKQIAQGDFLVDIDAKFIARKDEIGTIVKGIQDMKDSLKQLVSSIRLETVNIEQEVNHALDNINELNDNFESVSATTQELAASMEETAASSEEMSATSQEIERAVQSIAERSQEGAIAAKEISDRAEQTKVKFEETQKKGNIVFSSAKVQLEKAIEGSKIVQQIHVLSNSIMQITNQTNLLALNASIEASRAGEAGRGFSVVADEIRRLAEQSKKAVTQIQDVTEKVISSVENLSDSSSELLNFMSTEVTNDYANMLVVTAQYSKDASFVDDLVTEFSSTSEELLASIENILSVIDGVAIAADESASGTTEIAGRISEVNIKSTEVMEQVMKSKESANNLKVEISKFKL